MNALYLCVIAKPWINIIKKLEINYKLKCVYLILWQQDKKLFKENGFENINIHTVENAWKGLGFPQDIKRHALDEYELNTIACDELTALKMMDRLDPDGKSFNLYMRQCFFRDLVGYWISLIEKENIQVVISPSIPHRVFDYALYVASKLRSVRFLMFQMISFEGHSIIIDDINKMPVLKTAVNKDALSKDFIERIEKIKKNYDEAIPKYEILNMLKENSRSFGVVRFLKKLPDISKLFTTYPNTYWVKKNESPKETKYNWFLFYLVKFKRARFIKKLENIYINNICSIDLNNTKYVFLALHYQPEETSCPTGGVYSDQVLIIHLLNDYLPDDISIIIKEHRTQFYKSTESASGRTLDFYERIKSVSNRVKFVSVNEDPFVLIDHALATITISGTVGWESAIRGTPVLAFGRAWYENMPRVFKIKTKTDLEMALELLVNYKDKDLNNEILEFHKSVEINSIRAIHYKSYLMHDKISMSESEENIINGLVESLNLISI